MRSFRFAKLHVVMLLAFFAGTLFTPTTLKAHAQGITTGSISGTVADATGAVVPGATITATALDTNVTNTSTSAANGDFVFRDLPIGKYKIVISAKSFAGLTLNDVQVDSARDQGLGVEKLSTGSAPVVVEVTAAQALLETSEAQVTTTFDSQALSNLPVAGGFDELTLLIPGVVNTHADNFSNSNGVGFSVNGQRGRANNFELDGQSNNDNSVGGPQVFFGNEEALAQVQIITNSFAAQYGRNAGSVVNYITKSGTNSIHGSAIYKFAGDFTSSLAQNISKGEAAGFCGPGQTPALNGCATPVVPRFVSNWWGGTLGGPIIKDKLWGFGSTYFNHFNENGALTTSGGSLFPTTAGLAQLAAAFPNSNGVAILQQLNPYNVALGSPRQLANTQVSETVAGVGAVPFAQFGRQVPTSDTDQEDLGRLDWQATPKDRLFLRYFYQHNPDTPAAVVASGGTYAVDGTAHSVGSDWTHTFGPHWLNQLRYSFQQTVTAFNDIGFANCTITDFQGCPSSVGIAGVTNDIPGGKSTPFTSLGVQTNIPQGRIVKNGQVQDNATWTFRGQTILFGGEFDYSNSPNTFLPTSAGSFSFDTLDDFIAGSCAVGTNCSATVALGNPVIPFKEKDVALYLQDDWKVAPSLTLNLGLRWEFFQQALNLLTRESIANQNGPNPLWTPTLPLSQTTLPAIPSYYKNFEPRLGFAWNPAFNKRLVVRGGYAINVDPAFYNINLNVATSAPLITDGTVQCSGTVTNCLPTGGATFATVQAQTVKILPTGGSPGDESETNVGSNFRNPNGQTYTLGLQYQVRNAAVVEVRYVGNHGSKQFQQLNGDPYLAQVAAVFPNVVNPASLCSASDSTLPDMADVGHLTCGHTIESTTANTGFSKYNSLQTNLTTRNFHGVTATFAYTHSNLVDNTSEIFSTFGGANTNAIAQNPLNTDRGERGTSGIDFPNTSSISLTYKVPSFHTGHDLMDKLVNGWQANTIWVYNSGQPYTDLEFTSSQGAVNDPGTGALGKANPGDPRSQISYSDQFFQAASGADVARPILSNPKASAKTLGVYTDTTTAVSDAGVPTFSAPVLVDYATGAPISASQVRFISNNELAANLYGNPYPGSGRNILRGDTFNNVDFSVFKNTKITERVTFRLEVDAYNVLNRSYYGTPANFEADYPAGFFNSFLENTASGSNIGTGTGVRNMEFSGKIIF
jgi:hypothetical protein